MNQLQHQGRPGDYLKVLSIGINVFTRSQSVGINLIWVCLCLSKHDLQQRAQDLVQILITILPLIDDSTYHCHRKGISPLITICVSAHISIQHAYSQVSPTSWSMTALRRYISVPRVLNTFSMSSQRPSWSEQGQRSNSTDAMTNWDVDQTLFSTRQPPTLTSGDFSNWRVSEDNTQRQTVLAIDNAVLTSQSLLVFSWTGFVMGIATSKSAPSLSALVNMVRKRARTRASSW